MKLKAKIKPKKALVSVIMPVYNGSLFMAEAIESVLNQTYQNFELLIIDNVSEDTSGEIAEGYKRRYPKNIRVFHLKKNIGAFGAINLVLPKAKGEFIAPMDADDITHPQRLEKEVEFMRRHPKTIVLGSQAWVIDKNGEITGKKTCPFTHQSIYEKFAIVHPIVHPSCLIRRSLLPDKNRLYEDKFGVNDDYYTFFKLLNYGEFANLPEYLLFYRIHGGNSSLQNLKEKFFNINNIRLKAWQQLNYKPGIDSFLIYFCQLILVLMIPGKLLAYLYFLLRGMYSPKNLWFRLKPEINVRFLKVK